MMNIRARACLIVLVLGVPALAAEDDNLHPLMTSMYWTNVGVYFSARDFEASANGSIAGVTQSLDFESRAGLDDRPDLWNAAGGVVFGPWDHIGIGLNYQFFEVDGRLSEENWRGEIQTKFTGPFVYVSGHW